MHSFSELVFDDTIIGTTPVYTPATLNSLLGAADNLSIQVVVDEVVNPTNITVQLEHSSDGNYWAPKNGTPEIPITGLISGASNDLRGADTSTNPSLGLGRLKFTLGGFGNPPAHVKAYVSGRIR